MLIANAPSYPVTFLEKSEAGTKMTTPNPLATILIVDDNPTNLSVLFDYLNRANFKVVVAQDGLSAIERVNHVIPDLILLDVMMPGIDGYETLRRLKAMDAIKEIPIIFMTALNDTIDEVKGLELGAVDYISKPVRGESVLARIKTHLTIRDLQKNLQEQNAELDAFAHTVAHDLKDPLALLIGYSELMAETADRMDIAELKSMAKIVDINGRKMSSIINELLLLSTVRKGEIQLTPIIMGDILDQVQTRLTEIIDKYQGEIILPDSWPIALGHAPWVEEVWTNYLCNGLKYGGESPRLELGATPQPDGMIRFWVKDNGPGIAPEAQDKLFTEYTQLNNIRGEGHGLGLSIVRRIVEKLGGQVGVESKPGQGSLFYFTLPDMKSTFFS